MKFYCTKIIIFVLLIDNFIYRSSICSFAHKNPSHHSVTTRPAVELAVHSIHGYNFVFRLHYKNNIYVYAYQRKL